MPVGHDYPFQIVQRASLKVLGAACNPSTLRKTTGVMFTDHAGGGILRWMGWQDNQAFNYSWTQRKVVHPKLLDKPNNTETQPDVECIEFPSAKQTVSDS